LGFGECFKKLKHFQKEESRLFCPKCRAEFREGYVFCRKCNTNLVDDLPPLKTKAEISYTKDPETFLISVYDDNQAKIIESLLRAYQIPVLRRYNLLGHYFQLYWGLTVFGIELYVPANALKDAQAILDNRIEDSETVITQFEEYELDKLRVSYQKTRIIKGWIVIFSYLGVGLVFIVAYGLYQLLKLDEAYYG
jgi:hypothetical protein